MYLQLEKIHKHEGLCTYNVALRSVACIHCWWQKAVNIKYSECVSVALIIQHAMRMRRTVLSSTVCPAVP